MVSCKLVCPLAFCPAVLASSQADLARARTKIPGENVRGFDHGSMVSKLNSQLEKMPRLTLQPCESFSVQDLINVQRGLLSKLDPELQSIYDATDDNRRLGAFGTFIQDASEFEGIWTEELAILAEHPALEELSRDSKCHEIVMWFVHHIPEIHRGEMVLPLLPKRNEPHRAESFTDLAPSHVVARVYAGYDAGIGCSACHSTSQQEENTEYTRWPEEVLYTATGHGAFPFWDNSGPGCRYCNPSVSNSAQVKTMYSGKLKSEILMHSSCGDMTWTGSSAAPKNSPCNHIFTPDSGAFIYTPKTQLEPEADGNFCCRTYAAHDTEFPGAVPQDWMKSMTYQGILTGFSGDHYQGAIKHYTYNIGGLAFWYSETPEGKPVDQGEGCYQPGAAKKKACSYMAPIVTWHEFDTFETASFTSSDFEVPAVCKTTTIKCTAPGGSSGMARASNATLTVV